MEGSMVEAQVMPLHSQSSIRGNGNALQCQEEQPKSRVPNRVQRNTPLPVYEAVDIYQDNESDSGPQLLGSVASDILPTGLSDPVLRNALTAFNQALGYHHSGSIHQALQQYRITILSLEFVSTVPCPGAKHPDWSHIREIAMRAYNNAGCIEYHEEDVVSAESSFKKSASFIAADDDPLECAVVLSNLCRSRLRVGDTSESVSRVLNEVMRLRLAALPWDHPDLAATSFNLAVLANSRREVSQANSGLEHYLNIWRSLKKKGDKQLDPIPALIQLLLIRHGESDEAVSQELTRGLKTLQDKRRSKGEHYSEVTSALNYIGTMLYHKRDFENSLIFFEEELRREEACSADEISISITCNNMGRILQELGRYQEAAHHYQRALGRASNVTQEVENVGVEDHLSDKLNSNCPVSLNLLSTAWYNLGLVKDRLGDWTNAINAFNTSLLLRTNMYGSDHPDIACLHYNIGVLQMEQNLLDDASDSLKRALNIRSSVITEQLNDDHILKTLEKLAALHREKGNFSQAIECFESILLLQKEAASVPPSERSLQIGITFRTMADIYHSSGDLDRAVSVSFESVRNLHKAKCLADGEKSAYISRYIENLASSMVMLGSFCLEQAEPVQASVVFGEALRILTSCPMDEVSGIYALKEVVTLLLVSTNAPQA